MLSLNSGKHTFVFLVQAKFSALFPSRCWLSLGLCSFLYFSHELSTFFLLIMSSLSHNSPDIYLLHFTLRASCVFYLHEHSTLGVAGKCYVYSGINNRSPLPICSSSHETTMEWTTNGKHVYLNHPLRGGIEARPSKSKTRAFTSLPPSPCNDFPHNPYC